MTAMTALILYTGWAFLLILIVFSYRGVRLLGGTPINAWPRGNKPADDAGFIKRIEDAHANTLENLPILAVLVLAAQVLGKNAVTDHLAVYALYARVAQSCIHAVGTSQILVLLRATAWAVQLVVFGLMFKGLLLG